MIVRVQLGTGRRIQRKPGKNRHLALACGALLVPAALMAYVLAFWRLASDMGLVVESGITGIFSHWQVSLAAAVSLHSAATIFTRYGRQGQFHMPQVLKLHMLSPRPPQTKNQPSATESRRGARSG